MATIIDGKKISEEVKQELKIKVDELKAKGIILKDTPQGVTWTKE